VGALCAIGMAASANAAIREEPVTYTDGETTMKGFVLYDDAIIVMVHEWWGITKHIHNEARWGDDGSPGDFRWGSIESALALTYFANEPVLGGRTH
jgi:hypothetical protein